MMAVAMLCTVRCEYATAAVHVRMLVQIAASALELSQNRDQQLALGTIIHRIYNVLQNRQMDQYRFLEPNPKTPKSHTTTANPKSSSVAFACARDPNKAVTKLIVPTGEPVDQTSCSQSSKADGRA